MDAVRHQIATAIIAALAATVLAALSVLIDAGLVVLPLSGADSAAFLLGLACILALYAAIAALEAASPRGMLEAATALAAVSAVFLT